MACLDCDNCQTITYDIPECWNGALKVEESTGTLSQVADVYFEKAGGGVITMPCSIGTAGTFTIDFSLIDPPENIGFFRDASGLITMWAVDRSTGLRMDLTDTNDVTYPCALLKFKAIPFDTELFPVVDLVFTA